VTVLGIDPGTTGMGYALLALDADPPRLLSCGLVAELLYATVSGK
jgi:Holliday junction resolvasome RuvABC endonuclease subunit